MTGEDQPEAAVSAAVSLKLPPFYLTAPKFWFIFAEQQFLLRHITGDDTKFAHVVSSLTEDTATRVMLAITEPPEGNKYNSLKAKLLSEFTLSEAERASVLLDLPGLGDMKPSQLLSYMFSLLPATEIATPGILVKELFLRQLPTDVRAHLTMQTGISLQQLAEEADKFFTSAGQRVSAARHSYTPPATAVGSSQQPGRLPGTQRNVAGPSLCYFHRKFGSKARKCQDPCSYVPGNALPDLH